MIWRMIMFGSRLTDYIIRWPRMWWRFFRWMVWIEIPKGRFRFLRWMAGILMLMIDLTTFGLWYMTFMDLIKWNTRAMKKGEREKAKTVFGHSIPYDLITIDDQSWPARKGKLSAYVSLLIINYDKAIPDPTFIHELVHVWQYRKMGSVYITEALFAQKWGGGYNYGGYEPLMKYSNGRGLQAFNPEQQADIIEDYYRLKNNLPVKWVSSVPGIDTLLESYARQLTYK